MEDTPSDSQADNGFDEGVAYQPVTGDGLAVTLEGYEGPLDILLSLARTQKVDLTQISILQLAEQYLAFVREAQDLKIEVAADYLVMASWLAYLKSRLLLPKEDDGEDVSAEELAARLVYRLQVLEAMRDSAAQLMARNLMGRDFFAHGMPEGIRIKRESKYDASLFEVLAAYSTQRLRNYYEEWTPPKLDVLSIERARMRLERVFGKLDNWETMDTLVAGDIRDPQKRRTTIASSFSAVLEYVREGRLEVQQGSNFEDVLIRRARPKAAIADTDEAQGTGR
jgi:segregation and condensation protein A